MQELQGPTAEMGEIKQCHNLNIAAGCSPFCIGYGLGGRSKVTAVFVWAGILKKSNVRGITFEAAHFFDQVPWV